MRIVKYAFFMFYICIIMSGCFLNSENTELKEKCESINGRWSEKYKECSKITEVQCKQINGKYDECPSFCRHTNASICIQACDKPICIFE